MGTTRLAHGAYRKARGELARRSTVAAALAAVVALCVALQGCGPAGGVTASETTAHPTPTFAGFAAPKGQWVPIAALAGGVSSIAPSDPRVVYQVQGNGPNDDGKHVVLRRSDDGGATWHALLLPPLLAQAHPGNGMPTWYKLTPSPLDPHTVFLTVGVPYPTNCPTWPAGAMGYVGGRLASGYEQCTIVYRSIDGGGHWTQLHLPVGGQLSFANQVRPVSNDPAFYAQGSRLYSYDFADNYGGIQSDRLVRSDDGGATWQPIDAALLAQNQSALEYAPTLAGSTVFAVATPDGIDPPYTLWRSDDAGVRWHRVGPVPLSDVSNMAVVPRHGGDPLLYLATAVPSASTVGGFNGAFVVSADGGATWRQAPTAGLPASDVEQSILGVLSDGSILARSPAPSPSGPTSFILYAWKDGVAGWRQVAPPLLADGILTVTSAGAGHDAIWAAVSFANGGVERFVTG